MKNLLFVLSTSILFLSSCNKDKQTSSSNQVQYKYEVTGTGGPLSVTYKDENNQMVTEANIGSGWNYTWNQSGTRWLYLSGQNNSSGNVTVRIYRDGVSLGTTIQPAGYPAIIEGQY